jgi:hypothetical protein
MFRPVASAISKVKVMPAYLFNGVPSPDVTKIYHIFDVDGSITIRDEHYEEFGYELKINPLDYGFTGTVELYEDVEAETVMVSYKFKYKGKNYEVQVQFFFASAPIKVKIKGLLPKAGTIKFPFKTAKAKLFDFVRRRFWSGIVENGEVLWGVGFDWSDITASWSFDAAADSLSFSVGTSFELDPATICTTTTSTATREPFQRLAFYYNGRHWVFVLVNNNLYWYHSVDGLTWTQGGYITPLSIGRGFSVWFDGTYVHYCYANESYGGAIYYRRGTPNADGSITWSTATEQTAVVGYSSDAYGNDIDALVLRSLLLVSGTRIFRLHRQPIVTPDYSTYALPSTTAGDKYIFNPTTSAYYHGTGAWPTTIGGDGNPKGWEYGEWLDTGEKLWCLDGRFPVTLRVRNPTTTVFSGYLYVKLWKAPSQDMSGATALTGWVGSTLISFSGTANEVIERTINLDILLSVGDAFAVKDEYFFLEVGWQVASGSSGNRVELQLDTTYAVIRFPEAIPYFPTIAVDSNGYPWIGWRRYNGINYYPLIVKAATNDGTFVFRNSAIRMLSTTAGVWRIVPTPLTAGKLRVVFTTGINIFSQLWDGSTWTEQNLAGVSLAQGYAFSVIADGDDTILGYLEVTSNDIKVVKHTYGVGWGTPVTVQSATTSNSAPVLCLESSGKFKIFWAGSPTADHIYYKTVTNMVPDTDPTDWIDESTDLLTANPNLSCFYKAYGNIIGLAYMTKTASPYNVRYAFLSLVVAVPKMVGDGLTWVVA